MSYRRLLILLAVAVATALAACSPRTAGSGRGQMQEGLASYYAHKFHGRTTASGETYDENKMTAAHRKLPFNTQVRVTNLVNGRNVVVRINDRGPFVEGRIIDVSYAAAKHLDFLDDGVVRVRVEVVD